MSAADGDGEEGEVFRLPDLHFEGPNLDLPSPPEDLPYDLFEDWRSAAMLDINDIDATAEGLAAALRTEQGVLLAAAAHMSATLPELAPLLREVVRSQDDIAAVEAAYSLARLGDNEGIEVLRTALFRPVGPYLSPVLAAGYLAQMGDPAGFDVVRESLGSDLLAVKMLACKQLAFFAPFHGAVAPDGEDVDVLGLFARALSDAERSVQGQALAQLRWLGMPAARPLVESYLSRVEDPRLADLARATLAEHTAD